MQAASGLRMLCCLAGLLGEALLGSEQVNPARELAWLRILHHHPSGVDSWQSSINSPQFFLNPEAAGSPDAEWQAFAALRSSRDTSRQLEVACKFPARVHIYEELSHETWPVPPCSEFLQWKRRLAFHSLSMVYSTAYAGNPASIFGHNLLKINTQDPAAEGDSSSGLALLDYGVAFQAAVDPQDGPFSYVSNGLFGGYPGFFIMEPFYELVNTYAYSENRDLWEFEFMLTAHEQSIFLEHLWELIHQASAAYYFTHVNCSSMLLEILDAVRPAWNLRAESEALVLPQAIMQQLALATAVGKNHVWPSQRRIFTARYDGLTAQQRSKFADWRQQGAALALADDAVVLDAIIDQLNLHKSERDKNNQQQLRARETNILLARAKLPETSLLSSATMNAQNNPLWAHSMHKYSLWGGRVGKDNEVAFRLRYGLHDLLDEPAGFNAYYHINFFDLTLRLPQNNQAQLYNLEVIDLKSLNPFIMVDPMPSWAVAVGWGNSLGLKQEDAMYARASLGLSWELLRDRSLLMLMPDMNLRVNAQGLQPREQEVGLRLGWYHCWTAHGRQLAEIHPRRDVSQEGNWRWDWTIEQRWRVAASWQLEWRVAREAELSTHLGAAHYF